jgi:VHL beta domain
MMANSEESQKPSRVCVFIPTTTKLTSIVSLIEEQLEVGRSTVCINKTTTQARIANSYNDFVKQPTGVIHRLFAKPPFPVYRLDVSAQIEAGDSWQLAIFVAHALHANGDRLDVNGGADSSILWATGAVNPVDYSIGKVTHVSEKLQNSREFLEMATKTGQRVFLFIPTDNVEEIQSSVREWLDRCGITITPANSVNDVLLSIGLRTIKLPSKTVVHSVGSQQRNHSGRPFLYWNWLGGIIAFLVVCLGVAKLLYTSPTVIAPAVIASITPIDCGEEKNLRSLGTMRPTQLSFVNMSGSTKRIYWITFDGARQLFNTLSDRDTYAVRTYVTHPWVVTNESDKCEGIYFPDSVERRVVLQQR